MRSFFLILFIFLLIPFIFLLILFYFFIDPFLFFDPYPDHDRFLQVQSTSISARMSTSPQAAACLQGNGLLLTVWVSVQSLGHRTSLVLDPR